MIIMVMIRRRNLWLLRIAALFAGSFIAFMSSHSTDAGGSSDVEEDSAGEDPPPTRRNQRDSPLATSDGFKRVELEVDQLLRKRNKTKSSAPKVQNKPSIIQPKRISKPVGTNSKRIVNPHPFKFVLTPEKLCRGDPLVVAFVHSAPKRHRKRELLRATWGNSSYHANGKLRVLYVIASHTDPIVRKSIAMDHKLHHDILSEDFLDDYKNLTHKAVGALKWITSKCKRAKFVLKTDDDVLVNVFSLLRHMSDLNKARKTSKLLMCRYQRNMPVLRTGKWAVNMTEFQESHYPPYCSGLAYIMTMDVAKALYDASFNTPNMWVDDAWLTGMVAAEAHIKHTNIVQVYSLNKTITEEKFLGEDWYQYLFAHLGPPTFKAVWAKMHMLSLHNDIPASNAAVVPGIIVPR